MRLLLALLVPVTLAAQTPGGPRMPLPDRWIPLDSLATRLGLTDEQRAAAQPVVATIDSLMQRGAHLRRQARQERETSRNRDVMMGYRDQLERVQRQLDASTDRLRGLLTAEQREALTTLRPARAMPPRRQN